MCVNIYSTAKKSIWYVLWVWKVITRRKLLSPKWAHTHMGDDPSPTTRLSPENVAVLSQHDLFSRKWRQQHHHPSLLQPCRIFYNLEYYIKSSQNRFIYFALPVSSHIIQQPLQRKTFTAPPPSDCLPLWWENLYLTENSHFIRKQ